MKKNKQLKVTDLRIGDRVKIKSTDLEMIVIGIIWDPQDMPTDAYLILCKEGEEDDLWGANLLHVELIEKGGEV